MGVAGSVAGAPDANAIVFTGGANKLTFTKATTGLTGNIGVTGSLTFDQSGIDTTVGNVITGGGSVVKTGTHTITLSGANSYTGGTTVNTGTFRDRQRHARRDHERGDLERRHGGSRSRRHHADAGWRRGATGRGHDPERHAGVGRGPSPCSRGTVSAALAGMGGVSKTTGGTVILSGNNTYAGGTAINGGTVRRVGDGQSRQRRWRARLRRWHVAIQWQLRDQPRHHAQCRRRHLDTNGNAAALSGSIGGTDGLTKTGTGT